jgi:hypothetical protein
MTKLTNGTVVVVKIGRHHCNCVVEGLAYDYPTLDCVVYGYIVRTIDGSLISDAYPYSCTIVPESQITLLGEGL